MGREIVALIIKTVIALALSLPALGQVDDSMTQSGGLSGPRKQLSIIIFSGLAGAVLGLSTLSFYGRPQEKLENIAIGAAIGIIGGATFTTYKAATNPYETLGAEVKNNHSRFYDRQAAYVPTLSYQWTF